MVNKAYIFRGIFIMKTYLILILIIQSLSSIFAEERGPYKIILESITNCEDKGTGEISVVSNTRKEGDEIFHTGDLSLPFGLTDSIQAKGEANILRGGQWEPIGFISEVEFSQACSSIKSSAPILFDILEAANIDSVDCPISQGLYHFVDYQVKDTIDGFDELTFGEYRAKLTFSVNRQVVGCISFFAQILPIA